MKKLDRKEMKSLKGGVAAEPPRGCSMTYQNANGQWITEQGQCSVNYTWMPTPFGQGSGSFIITPFCQTASFSQPVTLSSNGGVSACAS